MDFLQPCFQTEASPAFFLRGAVYKYIEGSVTSCNFARGRNILFKNSVGEFLWGQLPLYFESQWVITPAATPGDAIVFKHIIAIPRLKFSKIKGGGIL